MEVANVDIILRFRFQHKTQAICHSDIKSCRENSETLAADNIGSCAGHLWWLLTARQFAQMCALQLCALQCVQCAMHANLPKCGATCLAIRVETITIPCLLTLVCKLIYLNAQLQTLFISMLCFTKILTACKYCLDCPLFFTVKFNKLWHRSEGVLYEQKSQQFRHK